MGRKVHLLPIAERDPSGGGTCKGCGRYLIPSDKEDSPLIMADADTYWNMNVDARCSVPDGKNVKRMTLAKGGEH